MRKHVRPILLAFLFALAFAATGPTLAAPGGRGEQPPTHGAPAVPAQMALATVPAMAADVVRVPVEATAARARTELQYLKDELAAADSGVMILVAIGLMLWIAARRTAT
jgi:hypothetical protein